MKKFSALPILIITLIVLNSCQQVQVNYLNESNKDRDARMEWWEEARFGMFIHWGLYAVPAGEWKDETHHAEWIRTTAQIPVDTYDQLINEFNPVNYNPDDWVSMAKDAGMKYIVITSKHHDGFCLFDSKYTEFDIMSTPYKKDLLDQLATACRKEGIKICWYHSIMDWHHYDYMPRRSWETDRTAEDADFEIYMEYMRNQLKELIENYGDISVLWFDGEWEETWTNEYGKDLYNYVRNLQPDIIINNRVDKGRSGMAGLTREGDYAGDFGTPEQEIPATGLPGIYWETCMTMNNHWGWNKHDDYWKSTTDLIRKLTDIASKGGNFLLNIGPKPDGTFPEESKIRLKEIGEWMDVNSDAIYGTMASPFKSLDFGRCTQKNINGNTRLYLHVFDWPENHELIIPGIYNKPVNSWFLADPSQKECEVFRREDALIVQLPETHIDTINTIVVLDVEGTPDISNPPVILTDHAIFVDSAIVMTTSDRENVEIKYTVDGTVPDHNSPEANSSITIKQTTMFAARCFREGNPVSNTSYLQITKVEPSSALEINNSIPGLICNYYEGEWDSLPDFSEITPVFTKEVINFDLSSRLQTDYYGFQFTGLINIPANGVYVFYTESDDGSQLFIDDSLIVDNDGLHGMEEASGEIALAKGFHKIEVAFFEKGGSDDLKVYFEGPGFERLTIPGSILYHK